MIVLRKSKQSVMFRLDESFRKIKNLTKTFKNYHYIYIIWLGEILIKKRSLKFDPVQCLYIYSNIIVTKALRRDSQIKL